MNLSSHCGSCVVAIGVLAGPAFGQEVLFELKGTSIPNPVDRGAAVGDWDGDGIDDLALMWQYDDTIATDAGAVRIHSGKDGSVLHTWFGARTADYFGIPFAMPDIDGDGVNDLLVSSPWSDIAGKDSGSIFLFGSASATQLWRVDGARIGIDAAPVHDLDADGIPDIFVNESGAANVLSGATGSLLVSIPGSSNDGFGASAIVLGDVNGDGTDDFLVGAPRHDGAGILRGEATIYSGADQSALHTFAGTTDFEQLGEDCTALDDVDGDGQRDFALLSKHDDYLAGKTDPVVRVYSGATNLLLGEVRNPDPTRYYIVFPRIEGTGDVSGDGNRDFTLLAGTTDSAGNYIWAPLLYSGRTLSLLYSFEHLEPTGVVFATAGDFDRDGRGDMLAATRSNGGRVRVYSGSDLWMNATSHDPATGGVLELMTREGVAGNLVVLVVVGVDGVPSFAVVNGLGTFDATGSRSVAGSVPPGLAGHDLSFKSYADGASGRLIESAVETITFR